LDERVVADAERLLRNFWANSALHQLAADGSAVLSRGSMIAT
jgi:hypothetical protein